MTVTIARNAGANVQRTQAGGGNQANRFIDAAMAYKGQPYLWGGGHGGTQGGPAPVDCSGLIQQAARKSGVNLDGTAASQQQRGQAVGMNNLQPGDLVFRGQPAHHVGIYIGNGQVLHAPHTGDHVRTTSVSNFQNARRVFDKGGTAQTPGAQNPGAQAPAGKTANGAKPAGDQNGTTKSADPSGMALPKNGGENGGADGHTVKAGDSLWKIAKDKLGDGNRWKEIYDLNKKQINDPNMIHPGQSLKMPADAKKAGDADDKAAKGAEGAAKAGGAADGKPADPFKDGAKPVPFLTPEQQKAGDDLTNALKPDPFRDGTKPVSFLTPEQEKVAKELQEAVHKAETPNINGKAEAVAPKDPAAGAGPDAGEAAATGDTPAAKDGAASPSQSANTETPTDEATTASPSQSANTETPIDETTAASPSQSADTEVETDSASTAAAEEETPT